MATATAAVDEEAEEEESIYLTAMATLCFCCIVSCVGLKAEKNKQ